MAITKMTKLVKSTVEADESDMPEPSRANLMGQRESRFATKRVSFVNLRMQYRLLHVVESLLDHDRIAAHSRGENY